MLERNWELRSVKKDPECQSKEFMGGNLWGERVKDGKDVLRAESKG